MSRRAVIVRVTPEVFTGMMFASFPGSYWRTDCGLPEGAKCRGQGYDWERNVLWFVFEHPSFAEVPDGELCPEFRDIRFATVVIPNPLDAKTAAMLEKLTAEQVKRATDAMIEKDRWANFNFGKQLQVVPEKMLKFAAKNLAPPDGDSPHVVG